MLSFPIQNATFFFFSPKKRYFSLIPQSWLNFLRENRRKKNSFHPLATKLRAAHYYFMT